MLNNKYKIIKMACGSTFKKKLTNIKVGGKNATESFSELNKKNMELKTVRMASNSFSITVEWKLEHFC